ncbi:MAG: hypothetical protein H6Q76_2643, partial [Firmicutes bacterium]|nr:hypothetical protein [Bacillota bacterium]
VDLIVFSTVFEYSIGSQYFEGYTYNTTSYQTSTVYGYGGSATIQTPVTITNSVPGGNRPVAYASVRFDVVDLQKGKNVITRLDDRARVATLSNTKPQDLYGRIIDAFMDDLSEKLQKSK